MQGAKTSQIMLPCWRRVHLHKSARFKMIPDKILTNQKHHLKIGPKMLEHSIKTIEQIMRKNIETYYPKYSKLSDFGSHFGTNCLADSRCGAFCLRPVFQNLWAVPPWTDFGRPRGTLGPI